MEDIIFPKPKVHLFVCINDRAEMIGNSKPSCGPRMTPEHVKELKLWIRAKGLTRQVYCTKVKCLGFCNPEGSVAVAYPQGRFVKVQSVEDLKLVIKEELVR